MFYLIQKETLSFSDEQELADHLTQKKFTSEQLSAFRVVKGDARAVVARFELQPIDGATATKRDKSTDEKLTAAVLAFVRRIAPDVVTVKAVADGLKIATGDVSRAKAALIKAGDLLASKKGTLLAKMAA